MRFFILLMAVFACQSPALFASGLSLEDYARHPQFIDVKISPNGGYLAASNRMDDGNIRVVVLNRTTLELVSQNHFRSAETIIDFNWANEDRLILNLGREIGALEAAAPTGEIYAVNANGRRGSMLTGPRSAQRTTTFSEIIDWLPDDDKHIVVSSRNWRQREPFVEFFRVNVDTGRHRKVGQAPIRALRGTNPYVITDSSGIPRLAVGIDPEKDTDSVMLLRVDGFEWRELARFSTDSDREFRPFAFSSDDTKVFGLSNLETDTYAIAAFDIASGKQEVVLHHPKTDVMPIFAMESGNVAAVIGAGYEYEQLDAVFLEDEKHSQQIALLAGLQQAFPNQSVALTSMTRDQTLSVVKVTSANQDPTFYLYDTTKNQLAYLLNQRPWMQNKSLPQTQIVFYEARDGQRIRALLTLPQGKEAKDLPLVVVPHGGPIRIRDSFADFNPITMQMKVLAEHGYAVLQPNFRGSGGYGLTFQQAGYHNWGTVMIDDMTDGVLSLVDQGIVDGNRVCTFGASYGGYAAVQTAVREPDLYKCSIAYVGLFDLAMTYTEGVHPTTDFGLRFIERTIGKDPELLKSQSPLHNLDRLKAPVFIVHGAEDTITPISHANVLRDALEKRNHPYEWLVKEEEGHGFIKPENKIELWKKAIDFLNRHIGEATP
ncbi:prolyl oligopeptidase family serine peptidase [Alkalimonas sp.]|uniref:alpha/beta hydrolase family protein n=1 Tax=Alkalimonas sp. TaxID=1872453 RepID=UPI00263B19EF|nr:prolyl oligopeptidase family serine peptidase [Alkalimonas sp.]MCC5827406.1 S9 family peptidase [Alkalimonas sp.]